MEKENEQIDLCALLQKNAKRCNENGLIHPAQFNSPVFYRS